MPRCGSSTYSMRSSSITTLAASTSALPPFSEGVDLESAQWDSFYWALYCSDSTMEAVRAMEERYRVKYELRNQKQFRGAVLGRRLSDGCYFFPFLLFREHIKNASNPQQYSMGNVSLRGSASQGHPSDGSGDRGRSEHLRIKSNAPGFSHPAGRQRGHRCQGCPQNGARCRRGRQSIWCTFSASSRPSARSRRRRSPEPLLAKCKASGIFSSSFCSVSLLYWSHTRKHTAEVLPFSAGKS